MAIAKLSVAQIRNMDMDQLDIHSEGSTISRDATLKGKTQQLSKNAAGMKCKAPHSEMSARLIALGNQVNFENVDQYDALVKRFQKLDTNKATSGKKNPFIVFLRTLTEKIFGNKGHREDRLKAYAAAEKLCAGYRELVKANQQEATKAAKKEASEKAFDQFMSDIEKIEPVANKLKSHGYTYNKATKQLEVKRPIKNIGGDLDSALKDIEEANKNAKKEASERAFDNVLKNVEETDAPRRAGVHFDKGLKQLHVKEQFPVREIKI